MFSLKKIASVVMATAMAVTTAVPGTAIVANAETTTIKTRVKNSDKKQNTINAADMNKLSINTENATVTYSSSLATDNAAAKWAKKEMKDSEKPKLGTPIAGKLDANKINDSNNGYWIKYSGITLNGAEKGEKYDLKVSVEEAHGAISGADGPYIAFHKKSPTSIRYSGYQWIVVTYTLTDAGKSTLASTWKGNMTFWDIDSYQGLEIRTPGRVTWAGLSDDSHLGFNIPDSRLPSASVKDNTVYSNNGHDATDGAIGTHAQQHALYLQTQLTPANNKMKIRFFTGGKDGKQPNGVFLSFDARNRSGGTPTVINFPLTKTVNGKSDVTLANSSDSFEYTLSTMCGNAVGSQIKSFVWNDTLESVLEFTGNPTVIRERDGKTENVTGDFTVKTNGQVLTATANKLTDDEMRGKFTLHFHAKVKAGANLSKYLNADKTEVVIPNKGTLTTKQDSGTKTNTSNTVNVRMKMAKLAVDKVVDQYEHKVGDTVNFTITTKETGNAADAANVAVTDTIPSEYKITGVKTEGVEANSSFSGQDIALAICYAYTIIYEEKRYRQQKKDSDSFAECLENVKKTNRIPDDIEMQKIGSGLVTFPSSFDGTFYAIKIRAGEFIAVHEKLYCMLTESSNIILLQAKSSIAAYELAVGESMIIDNRKLAAASSSLICEGKFLQTLYQMLGIRKRYEEKIIGSGRLWLTDTPIKEEES